MLGCGMMIKDHAGLGTVVSIIPSGLSAASMAQVAMHYDGRAPIAAKALMTALHMRRLVTRNRRISVWA